MLVYDILQGAILSTLPMSENPRESAEVLSISTVPTLQYLVVCIKLLAGKRCVHMLRVHENKSWQKITEKRIYEPISFCTAARDGSYLLAEVNTQADGDKVLQLLNLSSVASQSRIDVLSKLCLGKNGIVCHELSANGKTVYAGLHSIDGVVFFQLCNADAIVVPDQQEIWVGVL